MNEKRTFTHEEIDAKIEWEGRPSVIEWFRPDEIEDPILAGLRPRAWGVYLDPESLRDQLESLRDQIEDVPSK